MAAFKSSAAGFKIQHGALDIGDIGHDFNLHLVARGEAGPLALNYKVVLFLRLHELLHNVHARQI
jgi:hypothetical protein